MGDGFVTVGSFPVISDLALVAALLRDEDIPFQVLDGNTVHVAPHLAHAVGGARLQVRPVDVERTLWLLAEQGIAIDREHEGSPLLERFDEVTRNWTGVGRAPVALRLLLLAAPLLTAIVALLFFAFAPSLHERITGRWCVSSCLLNGVPVEVRTEQSGLFIRWAGCPEYIEFTSSGHVRFPGFNSREIHGHWRTLRGHVVLSDMDTLADQLDGSFEIDSDGGRLSLQNEHMIITADRWTIRSGF